MSDGQIYIVRDDLLCLLEIPIPRRTTLALRDGVDVEVCVVRVMNIYFLPAYVEKVFTEVHGFAGYAALVHVFLSSSTGPC